MVTKGGSQARLGREGIPTQPISTLASALRAQMVSGLGKGLFESVYEQFALEVDGHQDRAIMLLFTGREAHTRGLALIWLGGTYVGQLTLLDLLTLIRNMSGSGEHNAAARRGDVPRGSGGLVIGQDGLWDRPGASTTGWVTVASSRWC